MGKGSIGIFDSGFGGLSVWRYLVNDIPNKRMVYLADSGYCPYGHRSYDDIRDRTRSIVDFLIDQFSVKIVVVACNTATAAAIDFLRDHYSIPLVGMEPAIKPAALQTQSKVVGVLATEGTFNGRLFRQTSEKYANGIKMLIQPGHGLVEFIEQGITSGNEVESLLQKYISPMVEQGADNLVLGCTHYPFLAPTIEKLFPKLIL
ncbi:MAG TPA: glutamate racemase [Salinivirgaceae bacterium]|mgnify:FL=1|nr:glutamate racemase [Salinivirgaceae bacterium]